MVPPRATPALVRVIGPALLVEAIALLLPVLPGGTPQPPTTLGPDMPAQHGLAYDDMRLRTSDGVDLSSWYISSSNRAAIVLLHGAGSTRTDVLGHALVLARHGYGVLLLDARGHGLLSPAALLDACVPPRPLASPDGVTAYFVPGFDVARIRTAVGWTVCWYVRRRCAQPPARRGAYADPEPSGHLRCQDPARLTQVMMMNA